MEDFKQDPGIQKCRTTYVNKCTVIFVFLSGTESKRKQPNILYQKRMINGRGK